MFAALMLLAALLQRSAAEVIQGLIVSVVFGGIAFFCFRENSRKVTDIVAFYSRVNGKASLTPWYHNPNPTAFEAFLKRTDRPH